MKLIRLALVFGLFAIIGCKEVTVKIKMLPSLAESDSAVVMYYHIPGEPRFFNMIKVRGKNMLPSIVADANDRVIDAKNSCTTQGKVYFYGKGGAVEVIYFSREEDCMTLSFMKTGEKYFTKMSKDSKRVLDSLENYVTVLPGRKE